MKRPVYLVVAVASFAMLSLYLGAWVVAPSVGERSVAAADHSHAAVGHAPSTTLDGVDVSSYQGTIDWTSVAGDGITFAFARAVEYYGTPDSDFDTYMSGGNAAGVIMGAYDFVYPSSETASTDADYFNTQIKAYVASGYMYPALDLEEDCTASGGSLDAAQITTWVNSWGDEMETDLASDGYSGVVPTVYMNSNYAENCIDASTWGGWRLWIANYGVTSPDTGVLSSWNYWQYSDSGTVSGISGGNDMDYFNGDLSSLESGYMFGSSTAMTASYAMEDVTTSASLTCGGTFETGDTIKFTATASGSSGTYSYAWTYGDGATGTSNPVTHVYSKTGTVNPLLTVSASGGGSASTGSGCDFTVTVGLSISTALSASPNPVTVGSATTISVAATGGSPGYTYAYTGLPPGCSSTAASFSCTPTSAGSFPISVTVSDTAGRTATSSTTLTVSPVALSVQSFVAAPSTILVDGTTNLTTVAVGGVSPYAYAYTGLPAGCASADLATLTCTPTAAGNLTITVTVTDSSSNTATGTALLTVNPAAPAPLVITSFAASPSNLPEGNATSLSVLATGGVDPLTYAYAGLPAGCASQNLSTLACTPTVAGTFNVTVTVSDPLGASTASSATFSVYEPLVISSFTAPSITLGSVATLTVKIASGTSPYAYVYGGLPSGCSSANVSKLTCTPAEEGTYQITVDVTDALGHTASDTAPLVVNAAPLAIVSFQASPSELKVGNTTTLTVGVSGGTLPYTYAYAGLPDGCTSWNSSSLVCAPTSAGTFNVTVTVTDARSQTQTSSLSLQVAGKETATRAPGGNSSSSPFLSTDYLLLYAVVGAIVVIGLAVALRGRRGRDPGEESPPPQWGSSPDGAPGWNYPPMDPPPQG